MDAAELVPGDIVRLRLGDIIPADVTLIEGDYLSVDQSALTGESLPVSKAIADTAYSGSIAREGEMVAVVTGTGSDTFFGHTAALVETAKPASHFQAAVLKIGDYLIYISVGLAAALLLVQLLRGASVLSLIQFTLILVVAAIPVAMPAVLSVTMAVGARSLAKMKAIVARLESIEEMAGMDILCSDKTGTLTENQLTVGDPVHSQADHKTSSCWSPLSPPTPTTATMPSTRRCWPAPGAAATTTAYHRSRFLPFDPIHKRTESIVEDGSGNGFRATKGAPQVIATLCGLEGENAASVTRTVDDLAAKGYRTLGVARSDRR